MSTHNFGGTESGLCSCNPKRSGTITAKHYCLVLYNIQVLDLNNNNLKAFTLALPALRELHISGNKFLRLPSGRLFPNLETLTIQVRNNHISNLWFQKPFLYFALWLLCVLSQSNTLNMFGRLDLQSFRQLHDLQAGQNKFVCSCDFVAFFQSSIKGDGDVTLTDGEERYVCDSPLYLQGKPVGQVHLSVIECQQVLFVSVSCGVGLFVAILVFVLLQRLHAFWYLKMMWAWLKAKHSSRQRRRLRDDVGSEALLSFDAFVSYSERDATWVENFLVPELEEPRSVQNCLIFFKHYYLFYYVFITSRNKSSAFSADGATMW